jgi:hypothetical protein
MDSPFQTKGFIASGFRGGGSSKANIIIHVIHGEATEKRLEDELNNLINMHWDW